MHSSDDPPPKTTEPTTPEPEPEPEPMAVDMSMVSSGFGVYMAPEAGTIMIEPGMSATSGSVTFMCAEGGDACEVTVAVDDDGMMSITSTGGMVSAMNSSALDMAITAAAATKATAIRAEGMQVLTGGSATTPADAGLGGTVAADGTAVTTYSYTVARDSMGMISVAIADTAMAGATDPKFMQMMDFGDGRTMHVRNNGMGVDEVVIIGTDIEAATATAFGEISAQALNVDAAGATATGASAVAYNLGGSALTSTSPQLALVMASAFTSGTAAVLTFSGDDSDTADMDEGFSGTGTYNGAMGTYSCEASSAGGGTGCTVNVNAAGMLTAMSANWIFTPDAGATSDVQDAQYLSYGFWLKRTTDDDSVTYNEVETFAMAHGYGDAATTAADIGEIDGTATYSGNSVGVYMMTDDGGATSGHFMADVMLNASFGGGNVTANSQFTIGGTVTDFVLSGGEANDWAVSLGLADFSGRAAGDAPGMSAPGTSYKNSFSGVATGDSTAAAGTWNGTFWGLAGDDVDHDSDATTDAIDDVAPGAVIGEFNASFTDGIVAGGYGAERD